MRWILHPVEKRFIPAEEYVRPVPKRSHLPTPMVISDTVDGVQSMLDGKTYTSKAALRQTYKQAGVVELGNDAPLTGMTKQKPDDKAIRDVVEKSFAKVELLDNVHETAAIAKTL